MSKQLTLKEEYEIKKHLEQHKKLVEMKYHFDEDFILMEAIDDEKLEQMADAISKLSAIVSSSGIAQKVPTLKSAVDKAVADMQKFSTGGVGSAVAAITRNKMMNPITQSMSLFSALTKLFSDQMPKIIKAFQLDKLVSLDASTNLEEEMGASTNVNAANVSLNSPDTPILKLQAKDPNQKKEMGALLTRLQKTLADGLRPSGILGFFGLKKLPYIDNPEQVARELLNLSVNEFNLLANNIKQVQIPMSAEDQKALMGMAKGVVPQEMQAQAGQTNQTGQAGQTGQTPSNDPMARIQGALNKLQSMPDREIAKVVKGATSLEDFINKAEKLTPPTSRPFSAPTD